MSYLNHYCDLGIDERLKRASNLACPDGQDDGPVGAQLALAVDGRLREDGPRVRTVVNDINILLAAFAQILFRQKNYKSKLQGEESCVKLFRKKAGLKMLVKLTPVVNFINITLRSAFAAIFFSQKVTKPNCK